MSHKREVCVLLVEDNPSDVLILKNALGDLPWVDFSITHAVRLSDALELVEEKQFDVVLLDLALPDSVGLDTFRVFQDRYQNIPIVVLTANKDEEIGTKAVQLGAQDFLIKNELQSSLLGRFIRFAIERHHLQKTLESVHEKEKREQELLSMERLSQPAATTVTAGIYSGRTLFESDADIFRAMVERYCKLLDLALERRVHKEDNAYPEELRQIGIDLGFMKARPRDVIDIHISAMKPKTRDEPLLKAKAYMEEGRLSVLELMGNLAGYYRNYYVGPKKIGGNDE